MKLYRILQSDYRKFRKYGGNSITIIFLTQGFWAVFQHRIAHWIYCHVTIQPFRIVFLFCTLFWQKCIEIFTGISIPASARIGHSFYIGHFGGIILSPQTVIGDNCNISQGVTIGISGRGNNRGVPVIANNVYIGANAVVVGKINIGNDVLIGSCSLIKSSLQDSAVALGVPANIVSLNGSKGYI